MWWNLIQAYNVNIVGFLGNFQFPEEYNSLILNRVTSSSTSCLKCWYSGLLIRARPSFENHRGKLQCWQEKPHSVFNWMESYPGPFQTATSEWSNMCPQEGTLDVLKWETMQSSQLWKLEQGRNNLFQKISNWGIQLFNK